VIRTATIASLSCLLSGVLLPAQPQHGEPARGHLARAIKVIPVPQLVSPVGEPGPMPFGTMIGYAPGFELTTRSMLLPSDDPSPLVGDLPQLVRDLTPLSWEDGNVSVDLIGNALLVTGSPDQIHLVEQTLQQLTAALGEPFRLRAAAFHVDAPGDLPTVAPSFTDLHARLQQLGARFEWEATATAAPGQTVDLGALSTTSYVCDCDVEIAQNAAMANPVTVPMHLGAAVQAQAHPLAGSPDIVLLVQYARGETAAAMREVVLGKDETLPRLQSPTVAMDTGSFSGRIKSGGALVFLADGTWSGRRFGLLVSAERTPVAPEVQRELGVFPLGAFLSPALRHGFYFPASEENNTALWTPPTRPEEEAAPALDPADHAVWNTLFERAIGEEDCSIALDDNLAFVRGSPAAKLTASRLVELMQEQFLKTIDVDFRLATEGSAAPAQQLRFPVLQGRRHCVVHGVETTGVYDADVEVAQKAGVSDPKVVRHFSGTTCSLFTYGSTGNDLGAAARIMVVDSMPSDTFVPENKRGIPLDQRRIARSCHLHDGRVPGDGRPVEFGDGAPIDLGDRSVRTRPSLTLRVR